jgi:hypothetical protein
VLQPSVDLVHAVLMAGCVVAPWLMLSCCHVLLLQVCHLHAAQCC